MALTLALPAEERLRVQPQHAPAAPSERARQCLSAAWSAERPAFLGEATGVVLLLRHASTTLRSAGSKRAAGRST